MHRTAGVGTCDNIQQEGRMPPYGVVHLCGVISRDQLSREQFPSYSP